MKINIPCKVGDTIYFLDERVVKEGRKKFVTSFLNEGEVDHITLGCLMVPILTVCDKMGNWIDFDSKDDIGTIAFLNKQKAEIVLKTERDRG